MTQLVKLQPLFGGLVRSEGLSPEQQETFATEVARLIARLRSPHSKRAYANDWRSWCEFLEGRGMMPEDAKAIHVEAWLAQLRQQVPPLSSATTARRLAVVKAMYGAFVRGGVLETNPARESHAGKVGAQKTPVLSGIEFDRVLRFTGASRAERRAALLVKIAGLTGLRRSSIAALRARDLQPGTPPRLHVSLAKGGKVATVAIPEQLARAIHDWVTAEQLPPDAPVASLRTQLSSPSSDSSISDKTIRRACALVGEAVGVPVERMTPHALRRSFATHSYLRGVKLELIQQALLHESPAVTMRYIKENLASVEAAGNVLAQALDKSDNKE